MWSFWPSTVSDPLQCDFAECFSDTIRTGIVCCRSVDTVCRLGQVVYGNRNQHIRGLPGEVLTHLEQTEEVVVGMTVALTVGFKVISTRQPAWSLGSCTCLDTPSTVESRESYTPIKSINSSVLPIRSAQTGRLKTPQRHRNAERSLRETSIRNAILTRTIAR